MLHANTPFRGIWDTAQIFILVYVALAVPYRMGFDADAYGGWYVLEFFVDLYFWIDLCLGFFTAYWEHREEDDEVVYVVDLTRIRENYLRTWFTVDFLACIPVEYISRGLKASPSARGTSRRMTRARANKTPSPARRRRATSSRSCVC